MKRLLTPARRLAWKFCFCPEAVAAVQNLCAETDKTIFYKAGWILAPELVEGDYLEFGVFDGSSFIKAYHILRNVYQGFQTVNAGRTAEDVDHIRRIWEQMRFFAFDSFEGLPDIQGLDQQGRDFTKGKFASSLTAFEERLAQADVPSNKVVTVPGWFDQTCSAGTLSKHRMKSAAIIHVDCDLYSSAKTVLDFVKPLLVDGTIIIFDDWFSFRGNPRLGEQRAFAEWTTTLPGWEFTEFQREGPCRISFIASRV